MNEQQNKNFAPSQKKHDPIVLKLNDGPVYFHTEFSRTKKSRAFLRVSPQNFFAKKLHVRTTRLVINKNSSTEKKIIIPQSTVF